MMKAAVIVKPKYSIKDNVLNVIEILNKYNIDILLEQQSVSMLDLNISGYKSDDIKNMADFAIVLGGDGTLLYASRILSSSQIPILTFNLGRLGFIIENEILDFEKVLSDYLSNQLLSQNRMKLEGIIQTKNGDVIFKENALNDIVISKGAPSRMIELIIYIDGCFVTKYRSDGAIISTSTGSTGYTISAGGPIVHPDLDNIIFLPICPHALNIRPIVLSGNSKISITIETPNTDCSITYDGQIVKEFSAGSLLSVQKSQSSLNLVVNPERNYYNILRSKLGWGDISC